VVQFATTDNAVATGATDEAEKHADTADCCHGNNDLWAELMRRNLGLDVLACPRCGGTLRLIALIEDPAVIQRVLEHVGAPIEVPEARPARAPPVPFLDDAFRTGDAPDGLHVEDPA